MAEQKRFEEWEVKCNECARYWDSSCDGVCEDDKKTCMSYVATRSVVIPAQIRTLQEDIKSLRTHLAFIYSMQIGWGIAKVMGWL